MKFLVRLVLAVVITWFFASCGGLGSDNLNLSIYPITAGRSITDSTEFRIGITDSTEFRIGSERDYIFDTLGNPSKIFYGNDKEWLDLGTRDADAYHVYRDIGLSFRIFGNDVKEITLLNDNWIGSNGLIVGMPLEQMLAILGDDYRYFPGGDAGKDSYEFPDFDIMIEVRNATPYEILEINILEGNQTIF